MLHKLKSARSTARPSSRSSARLRRAHARGGRRLAKWPSRLHHARGRPGEPQGRAHRRYMDVRRSRLQFQADIVAHTEMAAKTAAYRRAHWKEATRRRGGIAFPADRRGPKGEVQGGQRQGVRGDGPERCPDRRVAPRRRRPEGVDARRSRSIDADTAKLDDVTREIGTAHRRPHRRRADRARGAPDLTKALNKARVAGESLAKAEAECRGRAGAARAPTRAGRAARADRGAGDAEEHAEEGTARRWQR